jgi:hypothetical protein
VPTVVLSLGKIFPSMRNDWLFGATFFLTRICYHAFLLEKYVNSCTCFNVFDDDGDDDDDIDIDIVSLCI